MPGGPSICIRSANSAGKTRATDQATNLFEMLRDGAVMAKGSVAFIFVDISSAFDMVDRS